MKTPCYQCPERENLCHQECERYNEFRAEREKIYEERKRQSVDLPGGAKWSPKVCP